MVDYTTTDVILKDIDGNYLSPYTNKLGKSTVGSNTKGIYLNNGVPTPMADDSANIALTNSPYTTNRILEIPQDIKLEWNNGTLTLKAGSKVYVPNGFESDGTTPKFDTVIISNDTTLTVNPDNLLSCFYTNIGLLYNATTFQVFSGGTAPTGQTYMTWYDTTNNIIKMTTDGGSTWVSHNISFPLCILSPKSVIDQVFNGFGYIGSTVFALPGVKVQAPNGKNKDGTYNSSVYTISVVRTISIDSSWGTFDIYLTQNELGKWPDIINGSVGTRYNSENNYYEVYSTGESKWVPLPMQLAIAKVKADTTSPYKITSFEPYTVDSVVNSNEFYHLKDKAVTTNTAQTISGVKTFTANTIVNGGAGNGTFTIKNDVTTYGTSAVDLVVSASNGKNQFLVHFQEGDKWCTYFEQNPSTKDVALSMGGCAAVYAPTPVVNANDTQVATTAWFNSKMQVVSALPANPDPNVFYFIPE